MRKIILALLLLMTTLSFIQAQDGHRIEFDIVGYDSTSLTVANHLMDKQYIVDTLHRTSAGTFVLEGEEKMSPGMYILVLQPDNSLIQFLVNEDEQEFSMKVKKENTLDAPVVKGSRDNQLFFEYLQYLDKKRPESEALSKKLEGEQNEKKKALIQKKLDKLNEEVSAYQQKIIAENPKLITSALIAANFPIDYPEFEGTDEEVQIKKWRHTQQHYFDHIDLAFPPNLRTPFLFQRVTNYVDKLQVQHPDTIYQAIEYVLEKMRPAEETFKHYLVHFLNHYAAAKIVGMDAVYVKLVDNYYAKGDASWVEGEQLDKIVDNANNLRPLLIGKTAPDLKMYREDGSAVSLHDIDAEYTILYFWRYDCGHCKKGTPHLKEFYEKYKDKDVKIVAICAKVMDEVPKCWEYIEEQEIKDWIHLVDKYHRSKFMKVYDVKTTPQLYILDRNKEIISKRIGAEQLDEVMEDIMEMNNGKI